MSKPKRGKLVRGVPASPSVRIHIIRGHRVVLSADLAAIYGVEPRVLVQAVNRNAARFPSDFAFRLTTKERKELDRLRSQSVILKRGWHTKFAPLAFTEHGAVMAAAVLNSPRAIQMSIFVVRAFLNLRTLAHGQGELAARLDEAERRLGAHDEELAAIIRALRDLLEPDDDPPRRQIGFGPA